jgi:hypothetical protein
MTQEDKELLLKDLCARLPYGVIIEHEGDLSILDAIFMCDSISVSSTSMDKKLSYNLALDEFKPYLLPLSSITEEQKKELQSLMISDSYGILYHTLESFNYMCKNNIDFRGLIPKGLAIDATGLNIY